MGRFFDGLIAWSIEQRLIVLLAAVAFVIAGISVAARAPLEALPDFTPPRVVVQTDAPGMGTSDVEQLVTRPIERVLLGTPQATTVRSTSSPGLSVVTLMFEERVDVYRARQLVTERLQLARANLPRAASEPRLEPVSAPIGALLKLCLTSSTNDWDTAGRDLRTFADWTLRPRLLAIPGVAQVTVHGGHVERIEVRPDLERMAERGVTTAELADAIERAQAVAGAGFVEAGGARMDIQNDARFTVANAPSRLAASVVAVRGKNVLAIGEVAEVVRSEEPPVGAAAFGDRPAVYIQVTKLPWADTVRTTRRVERALADAMAELPAGARFEAPLFRQADFVTTSIRSVARAMLVGAILVTVVLIAFLRHGRLAAISLTAIPLSILGALVALTLSGATINGVTLGGLAIAVGEVVDDAIVDVENVWRRLRENARLANPRPALDVIRDASREIRGSVVYATLIVCLVLLPVLLLGGVAGRIFSPLAQAYMLAIAASLLVALTVTPALCAVLLPRLATHDSQPTRIARALVNRYRRWLLHAVERPRAVLGSAAVLGILALAVLPFLGGRFLPEFHEGGLIAHVIAVPGTSLEETTRLALKVHAQMDGVTVRVASRIGRAELDEDAAPVHRIELDLVTRPNDKREWDLIVADVAARIGRVPGLGFVVEGFLGERVHEILSGETAPIVVKVIGPDLATLRGLAANVTRTMSGIRGIGTIRPEPQIDVPEIRVRPDPAALLRYGVRSLDLSDDMAAWRQGRALAQVLGRDGRVMDIALAGPPERREWEALRDVPIASDISGTVDLGTLAAIDRVDVPAIVNHEGGERRITIGADARGAGLSGAVRRLEQKLAEIDLPRGYHLEVGGEGVARREAGSQLLLVGALVLLGMFAVLAMAFASVKDAGIVLLNLPLGIIGGVVAAAFLPEGLSVAGFVGFVTLIGIISRNGIMLVAHKRHLDAEHPDDEPIERILRASEERLLPILMTAACAGLGLLPLALSIESAGTELESPMALIVCAGLITSTALNMLVLPTVYVWLERRRVAARVGA